VLLLEQGAKGARLAASGLDVAQTRGNLAAGCSLGGALERSEGEQHVRVSLLDLFGDGHVGGGVDPGLGHGLRHAREVAVSQVAAQEVGGLEALAQKHCR